MTAAALVAALVVGAGSALPPASYAARPPTDAAAEFLAGRDGGNPSDYTLLLEREARVSGSDERLWAGKLMDAKSGQVSVVYRAGDGTIGGPELLRERSASVAGGRGAFERKASPRLREAVAARAGSGGTTGAGLLSVAAWFSVDLVAAERGVIDAHPEVEWVGDRPLTDDLALIRRIRGERWEARREAIAAAAADLAAAVKGRGGTVGYISTSAPLAFFDLPAAAVESLAERREVETLGLEGSWEPAMSAAGPAVEANWTGGSGDQGNGIRVAVVEYHNVRSSGDLAGKVAASHSTSGSLAYSSTFDHPTWVAGAIAGQNGTYRGVAPGSRIVSSGTGGYSPSLTYDRHIIAAADWAVSPSGGDADIVNTSLVQDTTTGAEEARRYFDSIVDRDGRLSVSAAGNYVNFNGWHIGSPGTGYNVLTVGGVDDRGTAGRSDDRLWYVPGSNGSNWLDRPSDPWNAHGDYNKPNLVAPAVAVRTANGLAASGTSVATPIVSGVAAQVLANEPVLAAWPEGLRAVLMAGAVHRVPMPDGSRNVDHEGLGMASAAWANRVAVAGDNQLGGYRIGSLAKGEQPVQEISVRAGDRLRVALAWNSHASGSGNLNLGDTLRADLDLRVTDPNGRVLGSYTFDNSYEFVEVAIASSGVARLQIMQPRFDGSSETYGLAWAKVRDAVSPTVTVRVPLPGEPWSVPGGAVRVTFSETVANVSSSSFRLKRVSNGTLVSANVTYQSTSRTAVLAPASKLRPGRYEAILRPTITDAAGNALSRKVWRFTVKKPSRSIATTFAEPKRMRFRAGTHVGYRFDAEGNVTASRSYTLSQASDARADRRASIRGQPGVWLHVANGVWGGYWVRESASAGLRGRLATTRWSSPRSIVLLPGAHTGRRYSSRGKVTASKSFTLRATSSAHASRRAMINGEWHFMIDDGIWAGYWMRESASAHRRGMLGLNDLGNARATMEGGTRTAYRYRSSGSVRDSRTISLSRRSSAPVQAWGIINGRPSFYVTAGGWAGYWLPESGGVHLP